MHEDEMRFCNRPIRTFVLLQYPFFNIAKRSSISLNCGSLTKKFFIYECDIKTTISTY